jgi:hypothetical protein
MSVECCGEFTNNSRQTARGDRTPQALSRAVVDFIGNRIELLLAVDAQIRLWAWRRVAISSLRNSPTGMA